jgi:hypothetical protein
MTCRTLMIAFALAVAMGSVAMPAWAGGPGDLIPSCLVANPPGGATALRGTIAVGVQDASTPSNTDVDFTLRLERGGALAFFRTSVNMQVFATSNENIICALLRDNTTSPGAIDLRAAIRRAFGFSSTAAFFIVDKSLSKAEIQGESTQWLCNDTYTPQTNPPSSPQCAPPRGSSMADILIYVK